MIPFNTFAHSGRTDEYGGHWDNTTGEYHYHHGYPAHQHINGICKYNYVDNTEHKTGTTEYDHSNNSPVKSDDVKYIALIIFSVIVVLLFISGSLYYKYRKYKEQKELEEKQIQEEIRFNEEKKRMTEIYGGKSIKDFVDIPEGSMIDSDGLPRNIGSNLKYDWGNDYTFYASFNGKKYHTANCRYANKLYPKNAYVILINDYSPCSFCNPKLPDMEWVPKYKEIKNIQQKYGIEMIDE